jgi:hypothetical protein
MRAGDAIDKNAAEMFRSLAIIEGAPETVVIKKITEWFPFDPFPLAEIANNGRAQPGCPSRSSQCEGG